MRRFLVLFLIVYSGCSSQKSESSGPSPKPKPIPQTCASTGITEQTCDYRRYADGYCAWNPTGEKCAIIKSCGDIPKQDVCDSNFPREFGGCAWQVQNGPCFKPDDGGCKVLSNTNFGGGKVPCEAKTGCYWTPAAGSATEGECQLATKCDQLSAADCDQVNSIPGGPCYFDTASNSCKQAKNCGDFKSSDQCPILILAVKETSQAEQFCWWNSTACAQASKCEDITIDKQCNRQSTTLYCGWNSTNSKCEVVCSNIQDSKTCGTYSQCGWDFVYGVCANAGTTCGQITAANGGKSVCDASPLNCDWNGTQCVPGACELKPDLPVCSSETSSTACESAGCTWQPEPVCGSATSASACSDLGSDCRWTVTQCPVQSTKSACVDVGCSWCLSESVSPPKVCSAGCSSYDCGLCTATCACPTPANGCVTTSCSAYCIVHNNLCAASSGQSFACYGGCGGTSTQGTCANINPSCVNPGSDVGRNACTTYTTQTNCTQYSYCQWGVKVGG